MKGIGIKRVVIFLFVASLLVSIALSVSSCTANRDYVNMDNIELVQFEEIEKGSPIAVVNTSAGIIKAVLYPELAPETVENFISLAKSGYYDGTYVYDVEQDICLYAGGDEQGNVKQDGAGNEKIPQEIHDNLWPFKGAFCTVTEKGKTSLKDKLKGKTVSYSGSRFMILGSIEITDEIKENLISEDEENPVAEAFVEHGGVPNLSRQCTVFAQTYEGFDVLEEIISSKNTSRSDEQKENIMINSIEISTY